MRLKVIDRTGWPSGPWDKEDDLVAWTDRETGLDCIAIRNPVYGTINGYVFCHKPLEVHEDYGYPYLETHGGVSYYAPREDFIEILPPIYNVDLSNCVGTHVVGFDTLHGGDKVIITPPFPWPGDEYRSMEYVMKHCRNMCRQIHERTRTESS